MAGLQGSARTSKGTLTVQLAKGVRPCSIRARSARCSTLCRAVTAQAPAHELVHQPPSRPARAGYKERMTKETQVSVKVNLNGTGKCTANTPVHFLNHMFDQICSHGLLDVEVNAKGDTWIDDHHTVEDIALAFGGALAEAMGARSGINRFGDFHAPLDEALVHVVMDLSGRPYLGFNVDIPTERIGNFDTQLVEHFFQSMVNTCGMTLHIRMLSGHNSHHIVESTFKAFARALRMATDYDPRREGQVASSKGVLTQE